MDKDPQLGSFSISRSGSDGEQSGGEQAASGRQDDSGNDGFEVPDNATRSQVWGRFSVRCTRLT